MLQSILKCLLIKEAIFFYLSYKGILNNCYIITKLSPLQCCSILVDYIINSLTQIKSTVKKYFKKCGDFF